VLGRDFPHSPLRSPHSRQRTSARFAGTSDKDGKFTISNVPPGNYIVHSDREGFIDPTLTGVPIRVTVTAGRTATVDVAMSPGGTVSGRIRDAAGRPMQDVEVQPSARRTKTDIHSYKQQLRRRRMIRESIDCSGLRQANITLSFRLERIPEIRSCFGRESSIPARWR